MIKAKNGFQGMLASRNKILVLSGTLRTELLIASLAPVRLCHCFSNEEHARLVRLCTAQLQRMPFAL